MLQNYYSLLGARTTPKYPQYATKVSRVTSYTATAGCIGAACHTEAELADAGFFFAGIRILFIYTTQNLLRISFLTLHISVLSSSY